MSRFVIIDGNAIIHRAYHALPPLTTRDGQMVNAVYGFTSMLLRVWQDLKPTHLAVAFDVAGGTFRHEKYQQYKATRVKADQELYDQIPLTHEVMTAFNIPIYEKKGYEADDVIGTIVKAAKRQADEIFIITGDMDTIQLVDEKVRVYTLRKGINDIVIYNPDEVRKRFGFGPELLVDYKALRGDASDNIPGVPGIGEKTAQELITAIGGIQEIYRRIDELSACGVKTSVINKLKIGKTSAELSFDLATIDCAVPDINFSWSDCALQELDRESLVAVFKKFEFTSLLKRLPGEMVSENKVDKTKKNKLKKKMSFHSVTTVAETKELVHQIKTSKIFGVQEVASGREVFGSELFGLAVVVDEAAYYVPIIFLPSLSAVFVDVELELIGHDLKQLIKFLAVKNVPVNVKLFDTMIASYLLNPGGRTHDVAGILFKVLGEELKIGVGQNSLFGVDQSAVCSQIFKIFQAAKKLKNELIQADNLNLLEKMEMPLILALAKMELNGVAVDKKWLEKLSGETATEIKRISKKIYQLAGTEFNISSPQQLREVLFEKMAIPIDGIKKGKTGLSTSAEQLEKLRALHPIVPEIENYRELDKLRNTYIDVLPALVNSTTGRIHTTFNQAVTATGRLSSSDPNLQNIPIRTDWGRAVRRAFVAEAGNVLISADYSQIELRVVASLAEDEKMMEIFENDKDIHQATAAAINGVSLDQVTKEMRRAAKEINFGVLYGMGTYGLSWRAEIPVWQAKRFIEKYFNEFSGVKKYLDKTVAFTRQNGYCETLFGRRRYIPELQTSNFQLRNAAERMAINHPVQGTAADLMKLAMIAVTEKIANQSDIKMILQVHDELVFEVTQGKEMGWGERLQAIMEGVVRLRVPIKVKMSYNHSWGEMK